MGFCLFNNVAVTAATLAASGERVLVVDYDAHHGNGTQDMFWSDGRVAYVSLHQWPLYPGTGALGDVGAGAGLGTTVNVPAPGRDDGRHLPRRRRRGDRTRSRRPSLPPGFSSPPGSTPTGPTPSPVWVWPPATTAP